MVSLPPARFWVRCPSARGGEMGGMTLRVHLPGQLLSFRWPVPTSSFWAGSVSLLPLHILHSFPSPVGLPEKQGWGQGPCELWAAESSVLQTDPSWADLECREHLPPALSLAFLPFRGPSCSSPSAGGWQGPGGWRGGALVCMPAGVGTHVCTCVGGCGMEGPCDHNSMHWCGRASDDTNVGGDLGAGHGCHGAQAVAGVRTPVQ